MGEKTAIGWCDHTFNPWWGCARVSPGCNNCYAESWARRFGTEWGKATERRFFGDKHWAEPLKWNRAAERDGVRRRVFCASMADVFEDRPDLILQRSRLFDLIEATPSLDWLLLTKRPENIAKQLWQKWLANPAPNVWLGTTVEDQRRADERIPHLLDVPAAVRFLSCEPLIGPVGIWPTSLRGLQWVIVGGESGPKARKMYEPWALSLVGQCDIVGVPVFFKQAGKVLGREWGCPDAAGEDWTTWPEWARVREFPRSPA